MNAGIYAMTKKFKSNVADLATKHDEKQAQLDDLLEEVADCHLVLAEIGEGPGEIIQLGWLPSHQEYL
jgi:hypothetical protein